MPGHRPRGRAVTNLTRDDLQLLYVLIEASRDREVPRLQDTLRRMIAERAGEQAWGVKVFEWRLPLSTSRTILKGKKAGKIVDDPLAPTLNVYASMPTWKRAKLYKALDMRILAQLAEWPRADLRGDVRRRAVRVTRHSSSMPDEITVDVIGGKVPIDRLVQRGILCGDTAKLLDREPQWVLAPPSKGYLLIEVYELRAAGASPLALT